MVAMIVRRALAPWRAKRIGRAEVRQVPDVEMAAPELRLGRLRYRLPADRVQLRIRAVRDGLLVAGWLTSGFVLLVIPEIGRSLGYDVFAYWALDLDQPYARSMAGQYALGGFRYAPPIGFLLTPLGLAPWWIALWLWLGLLVGLIVFLGGRWTPALLALPPVALELYHGNVHLLIAVAIVVGFRYPWAWSLVLLTKVTPGIGLLWFAFRREWRAFGIALGATAVVAVASYVVAPGLWADWAAVLATNAGQAQDLSIPPPIPVRLPIAVLLVAWGAHTNRPWTVPIAAMLALPLLWPHGVVVTLAAVPLLRRRTLETGGADTGLGVDLGELRRPWSRDGWVDDPSISLRRLCWCVGATVGAAALVGVLAEPIVRPALEVASANLRLP
jgi:hypothetical protein